MSRPQESVRRHQRLEQLAAAALRALAADPSLHYRGGVIFRDDRRVPVLAPHLRVDSSHDGLAALRGQVDGISLRLRLSDPDLHRTMSPGEPVARLVFELLEQLRVESLAPSAMAGMVSNTAKRFRRWLWHFHDSGAADTDAGILLFAVAQMSWSRLNAHPAPEPLEGAIETVRATISPTLGRNLHGLRRHRRDQAAYARHAARIARIVADALGGVDGVGNSPKGDMPEPIRQTFAILLDPEADGDPHADGGGDPARNASSPGTEGAYGIFTTRYDVKLIATEAVRSAQLRRLREQLDDHVARHRVNHGRLAARLRALLAGAAADGWSTGQEEGHIDRRRLAQLVSSPTERRVFYRERLHSRNDCAVCILIDCSGSMKAHVERVAVIVDVLCRALRQARVPTEVLGFTTGAWNGGRALRDWLAAGRPAEAGRVSETCHLLFQGLGDGRRAARLGIAALLKTELFREGVDGEAIQWACGRLNQAPAGRRILLVISDGPPSDSATARINGERFLDDHLRMVVAREERRAAIEVRGLGVSEDISRYFTHSLTMDPSRRPDNRLFHDLVHLIAGRQRR